MSDFRIITCVLGDVSTNCYIISSYAAGDAVIIDPAADARGIVARCEKEGLKPEAILLTHGHFDHILAVDELVKHYRIPVYASKEEVKLLQDPSLNFAPVPSALISIKPECRVIDREILNLAGFSIEVIHTPGHTAGCVCYYFKEDGVLMSGDTLFLESLGRTDLPTSNTQEIIDSIQNKLFVLPKETKVYPGHGPSTTIGHEKRNNPVNTYRG